MSTINYPPSTYSPTLHNAQLSHPDSTSPTSRPNTQQSQGPDWSSVHSRPASNSHAQPPATGSDLSWLKNQLNKDKIDRSLRSPSDPENMKTMNKLRDLLTPGNISALLHDPDARANAQTLTDIGGFLSKDTINHELDIAMSDMDKTIEEESLRRQSNMLYTIWADPDNDSSAESALDEWKQSIVEFRERAQQSRAVAQTFTDIGHRLSKHNIDAEMDSR